MVGPEGDRGSASETPGPVTTTNAVAHTAIAAVISNPFGLMTDARYTLTGVSATSTPAPRKPARPIRRHAAAARPTMAAEAATLARRIAQVPCGAGRNRDGQPTST